MTPLYSNILVQQDDAERQTEGGLYIPETNEEKPLVGTVLAVGEGYVNEDGSVRRLTVKKGDRIIFGKYSGAKISLNGDELVVMDEADVYGIV